MQTQTRINTPFRAEQQLLDNLDYLANKMGLSRNQLMTSLLTIGTEDLLTMDKLGMIRLGVGIRSVMEKLNDLDGHPSTN